MKIRPSGLLVNDGKILTMHYNYNGHDLFALPGGNQENQDGLAETLTREFEEELNLSVRAKDLLFVAETLNNKGTRILHLVFRVECQDPKPHINPGHTTCLGFEWLPIAETRHQNLYPNIGQHLINPQASPIYLGQIEQRWF